MAEGTSQSPPSGDNTQGDDMAKQRLTDQEKKQNHIASEQKRREAIRAGFDRLCDMVPGLEGQGRSEGYVLKKTVEYMRIQLEERRRLVQELEAHGQFVAPELKESLRSWKPETESEQKSESQRVARKPDRREKKRTSSGELTSFRRLLRVWQSWVTTPRGEQRRQKMYKYKYKVGNEVKRIAQPKKKRKRKKAVMKKTVDMMRRAASTSAPIKGLHPSLMTSSGRWTMAAGQYDVVTGNGQRH